MRLNELSPAPGSKRGKRRVGRGAGSGWGKTCSRGMKGQKARSGGGVRPGFEGGQMPLKIRVPKWGFRSRVGLVTAEVRSAELGQVEGDVVDIASLQAANVIARNIKYVKVMLSGEVTRALTVKGIRLSKGALEAVTEAGGKVEA